MPGFLGTNAVSSNSGRQSVHGVMSRLQAAQPVASLGEKIDVEATTLV